MLKEQRKDILYILYESENIVLEDGHSKKVKARHNEKKKNIETAEYVYEAGDIPSRSCCYSKCFTDEITGLTSLEDLEVSLEKTLTIDELIEYLALSDKDLKDYFDFII